MTHRAWMSWSSGKDSTLALAVAREDPGLEVVGLLTTRCGENGEFHTFVPDGPGFARPLAVRVGEVVERDGFVFADVLADSVAADQVN